ncbi:hypothetical protein ACGFNP_25385 [Nonomuraea sp. NPDC049269]|uniref:hypothetical protein n=1 Tax=Nonomuraea sp. NPDC049269 TaxID=3364349 RepID=UPI003713F954
MSDHVTVTVDETEGSAFARIRRIAVGAANGWTLGPNGPYRKPGMAGADIAHGQVRAALLHLLELGLITIDEQRLNEMRMYQPWRDEDRG